MPTMLQIQDELSKFEELCIKLDTHVPASIMDKMLHPKLPTRYLKTLIVLGVFDCSDAGRGRAQATAYAAAMLSATNGQWNRLDFRTSFGKIMGILMPDLGEPDAAISLTYIVRNAKLIKPSS